MLGGDGRSPHPRTKQSQIVTLDVMKGSSRSFSIPGMAAPSITNLKIIRISARFECLRAMDAQEEMVFSQMEEDSAMDIESIKRPRDEAPEATEEEPQAEKDSSPSPPTGSDEASPLKDGAESEEEAPKKKRRLGRLKKMGSDVNNDSGSDYEDEKGGCMTQLKHSKPEQEAPGPGPGMRRLRIQCI